MSISYHDVDNVSSLLELTKRLQEDTDFIYLFFTANGDNEYSDAFDYCKPTEIYLKNFCERNDWKKNVHFLKIQVNAVDFQNGRSEFSKEPFYILTLPTLLRWEGPQKLEGKDCINKKLVKELFSDDEGYAPLEVWDFNKNEIRKLLK